MVRMQYNYLEAPDYVHKPEDVVAGCDVPVISEDNRWVRRPIPEVSNLVPPDLLDVPRTRGRRKGANRKKQSPPKDGGSSADEL